MKICKKCLISKPESNYNKRWPRVCKPCQNAVARAWYESHPRTYERLPLYSIYANMLQRCNQPSSKTYKHYGARGIKVCTRWTGKDGYQNFVTDMGPRPTQKHTIDRENNDGNYEPSNCRWATPSQQQLNRRIFKSNTSGYRGVSWDKSWNKWRATIRVGDKKLTLGAYDNPIDAAKAFNAAAIQYRGVDAVLNKIP
jgi:hypothetical protein